jgi:hypothetical protein
MNRKFLVSWVVIFVISMAVGFVVHGWLLHADYAKLPHLFRTQQAMHEYFPFMLLAQVLMAGAFVWIYVKGKEDKAWLAQGARYGIAIAILTTIPVYLIYYTVQPMPGMMVAKQIVLDTIGVIVMGIAVAWLYRANA